MKISKKIILPIISAGIIAAPVAATISCSSESSVLFQGKRTLVSYSTESSFTGQRNRVWDLSVQAKNVASRDYYYMTNVTFFREQVIKNSIVKMGKDGSLTETQKKEEKLVFDGINSVTLKDSSNNTRYTDADAVLNQLKDPNNQFSTMVFTVPQGVKYVDSSGKKTKYNFRAIDYFYGMMRSLYINEEIREKGTILGIPTGLPIMEKSYIDKMKDDQEFYPDGILDTNNFDNANVYLYNLFGVDLKGTFEANTGTNADKDKFVLKFNSPIVSDTIFSMLSGSTFINPISSEKINEITGQNYKDTISGNPGSRFAILEYGKSPITNDKADLSGMLTVSRYYWKQYDIKSTKDEGTGLILKKNMHSYDKQFIANNKNIVKYQILINGKGDQDIFSTERQRSFLNPNNSESLLNTQVKDNSTLMKPIVADPKYLKVQRSSESGPINQGIVNPYYYLTGKDKVGDNEAKLLFGTDLEDAKTNTHADEEYFNGRGRQFRTLINNSVNLYALSKEYYSSGLSIKSRRNYKPNQPIVGGTSDEENTFGYIDNQEIGVSVFSTSDSDSKNWYSNNTEDRLIALKPSDKKFEKLKKLWATFANETRNNLNLHLASNTTFEFPLYDYRASDADETKAVSNTFKVLVEYLNTITKDSGISFREFDKNAGSKEENSIANFKSAPFYYAGAGADYGSVISLVQQYISASYGYAIGIQILTAAFDKNSQGEHLIKDFNPSSIVTNYSINLIKNIDISRIFKYIKNNKSRFPILSNAIDKSDKDTLANFTMTDWHKFKSHTFDAKVQSEQNTKLLLNEVDNLFQQYMFSISTDKNEIIKWTNLLANYNMVNKLAMGYTSYSSLTSELGLKMPIVKIYEQPWLHLAEKPSHASPQLNIVDTYVED